MTPRQRSSKEIEGIAAGSVEIVAEGRTPLGSVLLKPWQGYGFALLVTVATLALRLAFDGPLGERPTLVIFTMPIMLSAYVGGLRAGLLATVLSFFAASYYLLPPLHSFAVASKAEGWQLFFVVLAGVLISVLNEALHRARRRTSVAIREQEKVEQDRERFFALSQDMLCILGFDGYFKDVNPAWSQTLGYSKAELLATTFIEFVHPDDREATLAEAGKVSGGKALTAFENRYRCKDGSHRFFQWSVTPVIAGGVMYGVARDITERKQAEVAAMLLAAIVGSSADAIIGKDLSGMITSWNAGAEKIFGYPAREMLGQSIMRLIPADRHNEEAEILKRVRRGESVRHFDTVRLRKDGSYVDISVTTSVIRDASGKIIGASKVARDITERKRMEEAQRTSENQLRLVTENARVGLVMVDTERRYTFANTTYAEILGLPSADIVGQRVADVLSPLYEEQIRPHLDRAFAGMRVAYELRRPGSGETRHYAVKYEPMKVKGTVSLVVVVITDFTEQKQAEDARGASEARYRTLFECAPDGIVVADPKGTYLDANGSICRMLGYTREEMIGLPSSRIVAEEESEHIGPALSAINTEKPYRREWQFRRKDDSLFTADVIATKMPDGNLLAMIHDITERKRSEARMLRLVDSHAQGVIFWNRRGEILKANDAFLRIVGYTREDLKAGRVGWAAMTPPEYAHLDRHSLEEIAATGVCTPIEKEYIRKDGSRVPIMIGAANFEDNPDEGVSFVLDITKRKQTEQALRVSEEHFRFLNDLSEATRTLSDPAQIMTVMARMLGKHLRASRCAYADVDQGGEQFTILHDYTDGCASTVGNYHLSLFGPRAVSTLQGGQTLIIRDVKAELMPGDGAEMFDAIGIKAIVTCPLVKEGRLCAMMAVHQTTPRDWKPGEIAIVHDVVERCWATIVRRTAEEKIHQLNNELEQRVIERTAQLEAANKELEAFSYSVSHDLRAPLRGVNCYVRMLKEDCADRLDAEGNRLLDVVSSEAKRMGQLIDDLLAFSRLGREQMKSAAIDMTALANSVFETSTRAVPDSPPRFDLKSLPPAQGDLSMLRQVFVNLIGNAVKFTRHERAPLVEVGGKNGDGETIYYVKDNGVGFDEKYGHKLFGVFQRLHSEEEFEGTGVGLALVQRVIHRHGGRVWAEGKPNQGATFYFTLPIRSEPANE